MPSSQQPTTALPGVRGQQLPPGIPPRPPVRPAEVEQDTSVMPSRRPRPQQEDRTNYVRTLAPLVGMSVVVVVVIAAIMAWISSLQEPASPTLTANRPAATAPPAPVTSSAAPTTSTKPKATITRTVPKVTTTRAVPKTTAPVASAAPGAGAGASSDAPAPTTVPSDVNGDNGGGTPVVTPTKKCNQLLGCANG